MGLSRRLSNLSKLNRRWRWLMMPSDDRLQMPYVCGECDHQRYVVVNPDRDGAERVRCPECGNEDELTIPDERVEGLGELLDSIHDKRGEVE